MYYLQEYYQPQKTSRKYYKDMCILKDHYMTLNMALNCMN